MSAERRASLVDLHAEINKNKGIPIAVPADKAPADIGKAAALTQHAINNLGGPIYASMTDHKVVDSGLAQAKTLIAIKKGDGKSVDAAKAPADRALSEALTLGAISSGKAKDGLKQVDTQGGGALSKEQLEQLQADAAAQKKQREDAKKFGGGDAKETMPSLMAEINLNKGATISVPAGKAPDSNISLNHTKLLMEVDNMKGEAIFASMQDHKPADAALNQAKTLMAISKKGESAVDSSKAPTDRAINEALTMKAIDSGAKKSSLKAVGKPAEGLTKEQLAALQAAAIEEKGTKA